MRIIREQNLEIICQKMELDCFIEIAAKKSISQDVEGIFGMVFGLKISRKVYA